MSHDVDLLRAEAIVSNNAQSHTYLDELHDRQSSHTIFGMYAADPCKHMTVKVMEGQLWDSLLPESPVDCWYPQAGLKADYARSAELPLFQYNIRPDLFLRMETLHTDAGFLLHPCLRCHAAEAYDACA